MTKMYSADAYFRAFRKLGQEVSEAHRRMLCANAGAKGRTLDVFALATAAGQTSEKVTYSQYGRLGHLVAKALGHHRVERVWTRLLAKDSRNERTGRVQWTLHQPVATAVKALGWMGRAGAAPVTGMTKPETAELHTGEPVGYFVMKGTRANDWGTYLQPGRTGQWVTARPPSRSWKKGDRLFCWESTPGLRVVGLAQITNTAAGLDRDGRRLFGVRYLTRIFKRPVGIAELRATPVVREASFLKSGPAMVLHRLTSEQARALYGILVQLNPGTESVWPDLAGVPLAAELPDVDDSAVREGGQRMLFHLVRERDKRLIARKREAVFAETGRLSCEVCTFDFAEAYGSRGEGFCEVHHVRPLAEVGGARKTRLADLAILCSNCHRIVHRSKPGITVAGLRRIITGARKRVRSRASVTSCIERKADDGRTARALSPRSPK